MTLRDMDPELRSVIAPDGSTVRALWFWHDGMPYCVPFGPQQREIPRPGEKHPFRIWQHVGGSTVDDLTLRPSYSVCDEHGRELFHKTLTKGVWA